MIDLEFRFVQQQFFSVDKIQNALDRKEAKALGKVGAYVRRRARSSLRRRKRVSRPGQTPSVHTSGFNSLKAIFFFHDKRRSSVTIGILKLNRQRSLATSSQPLPNLMEFGGTMMIPEYQNRDGEWRQESKRSRRRQSSSARNIRKRVRRVRVQARPVMSKALSAEVNRGTIPEAYRGLLN